MSADDHPNLAPAALPSDSVEVGGENVAASGSPSHSPLTQPAASGQAITPMKPSLAPTEDESPVAVTSSGPVREEHVREELKKVIDPELFVNIIDLGLIYVVDLAARDDGRQNVKIDMTMTSPACPAGPQLIHNSKQVLAALPGVGDIEIRIVLDPPWTPDRMTEAARDQLGIF